MAAHAGKGTEFLSETFPHLHAGKFCAIIKIQMKQLFIMYSRIGGETPGAATPGLFVRLDLNNF